MVETDDGDDDDDDAEMIMAMMRVKPRRQHRDMCRLVIPNMHTIYAPDEINEHLQKRARGVAV